MSKVMVSLPDDLLRQLDAEARRRSMTRSGLLAAAVRDTLQRRDLAAARRAVERSRQRFDDEVSYESADLVRVDRDRRG